MRNGNATNRAGLFSGVKKRGGKKMVQTEVLRNALTGILIGEMEGADWSDLRKTREGLAVVDGLDLKMLVVHIQ